MGLRDYIAFAAKQYGADPGLLDSIAKLESTYNPKVMNDWDINAKNGTPSGGLFQFIQPTYESFSKEARRANPNAWRNVNDHWMDPRAQALTTAWAVKNGKGSHWATYDRAKQLAGSYNYKPRFQLGPGGATRPGSPTPQVGAPNLALQPAQLNPREKARLAQMQLPTQRFNPVEFSEDERRKLALRGGAAGVIRNVNLDEQVRTEQYNQNALDVNRQAEQTLLATKNESIRQKAMNDWLKQTGSAIQNMPTAGNPMGGARKPGGYQTPRGFIRNQFEGEAPFQFLQRLGTKGFGLANDPGNSQLNGGRHSAGSEHYSDRAIDFGTARNSPEQLKAWLAFVKKMGFDALDEGDHIHVSMPGSGL